MRDEQRKPKEIEREEEEDEQLTFMATKPLNGMNKTVMKLRSPSQTRHFRPYILPHSPISSTTGHVSKSYFLFYYLLWFFKKKTFPYPKMSTPKSPPLSSSYKLSPPGFFPNSFSD